VEFHASIHKLADKQKTIKPLGVTLTFTKNLSSLRCPKILFIWD